MNILAPSILSADFWNLGEDIKAVEKAGAQYLHIDVMDGIFVPSITYGMPVIASIRKKTEIFFDVHLMITEPIRYIEEFVKSGADLITFHLEATDCVEETIRRIREFGVKVGISIKPGTPVDALEPYLELVDMVLVMTVEPGFGGQKYIDYCTDKVVQVRKMITEKGLQVDVQVDGGINKDNLKVALDAGANVIVAGSTVFKGDIRENVKSLLAVMQ